MADGAGENTVDTEAAAAGNAFGVPTSLDGWLELICVAAGASAASEAEVGEAASQAARRMQLAEATGRWKFTGANGYRQPHRYVPRRRWPLLRRNPQ